MHRLSRFFVVGALALLASPAAAQVVRAGDDVPGQPGAVPVTATDGRTAKVPAYIPVRTDGTVIDPVGTGASANQIQGNAASGVTDVGNPVKVGGVASAGSPAAVTAGQRTNGWYSLNGATVISYGAATAVANAFSSNTLISAMDAGGSARTLTTAPTVFDGANLLLQPGNAVGSYVIQKMDAAASSGVAPVVTSAVAGGQVIKASAGNLFGLNVVSGASAGFVLVTNTTTVPADGAVTPLKCYALPANSSLDLNLRAAPVYFSAGISVSFSTTGCFSKTASATAFISGDAK